MSAALALAVALAGPAALPPGNAEVVQLLRDACVATEMRRDAFEQLARSRRWSSAGRRPESVSGGWSVMYRAGDAVVLLVNAGAIGDGDRSLGSVCTVGVQDPENGLSGAVGMLAESLGLTAEAEPLQLGGEGTRAWSTLGRHTLIYSTAHSGPAVSISLSRQHVVEGPAPAVPAGGH